MHTKLSRLGSRGSDVVCFLLVLLDSTCCDCVRIISRFANGWMLGGSGRNWGIWILYIYKEEALLEEKEHHSSSLDILLSSRYSVKDIFSSPYLLLQAPRNTKSNS